MVTKYRAWWQHPEYKPEGGMFGVAGIMFAKPDDGEPEYELLDEPYEVALVDYPYQIGSYQKLGWNKNCRLMQYTGLKDKNGVEIYEGDILDTHVVSGRIYKVYYNSASVSFNLEGLGDVAWVKTAGLGKDMCSYTEVIGNIHENPELLNKEGDTK